MPKPLGPDPRSGPLAYFLTFTCYGSHLHGQAPYTRQRTTSGTITRAPNPRLHRFQRANLHAEPYTLDAQRRQLVLAAFQETATYRGWTIHAAHIRTDHAHLVISASAEPSRLIHDLKSYASRHLREQTSDSTNCKRWTRHASTRRINTESQLRRAIQYTIYQLGEPMTVFDGAQTWPTK